MNNNLDKMRMGNKEKVYKENNRSSTNIPLGDLSRSSDESFFSGNTILIGVLLVVALVFVGVVIAQGVDVGELEDELGNLSGELIDGGYDWLINYSLEEVSADVEVYLEDGSDVIAVISNITGEGLYKTYLDGSSGIGLGENESFVFDLKVVMDLGTVSEGNETNESLDVSLFGVEFDWIVDPTESNSTCDEGDNLTTCNITTAHTIEDGSILTYNNVIIKSGGALINDTANCTGASYGCGFSLVLTGNLTIESGGNITAGNVSISAENIDVQTGGLIYGYELGWMALSGPGSTGNLDEGASHAGYGGVGTFSDGADPYGDALTPRTMGSGAEANPGGGALTLNATGNVTINGDIDFSGGDGNNGEAGGAGGSIWIIADTISGINGTVNVDGGGSGAGSFKGGGGGRVRFEYTENITYTGTISTVGGIGNTADGFSGVFTFTNNTWPTDWNVNGSIGLLGGDYGEPLLSTNTTNILGSFTIPDGYSVYVYGDCYLIGGAVTPTICYNVTPEGQGVWINASGNITVESTATINGDGLGFPNKLGPGATGFDNDAGTYGGIGAGSPQSSYGNFTAPTSLGSGGYNDEAGSAIKLESDTIVINGSISVDGNKGFNSEVTGSGGSIWITGNSVEVNGNLSAHGGDTTSTSNFGGGGGRIAITSTGTISLGGDVDINGGIDNDGFADNESGSAGTIYISATTSINSSGDITGIGYNGTYAFINITTPSLLTTSGVYNVTAGVTQNGTITVDYGSCQSSSVLGSFVPVGVLINNTICEFVVPTIDYTTGTPSDGDTLAINSVFVNVSVVESNPKNITFNLYNNDDTLNTSVSYTSGFPANYSHNFTSLLDAPYKYNVTVYDSSDNVNSTATRSVTVDTTNPGIDFVSPTLDNAIITPNDTVIVNVSITDANLDEIVWNWNGTNYTLFNDSLVLFMNFDNRSSFGENDTHVVDISNGGNNGTVSGGNVTTADGKYGRAMQFDGVDDYIEIDDSVSLSPSTEMTFSAWVYANSLNADDAIAVKGQYNSPRNWAWALQTGVSAGTIRVHITSSVGESGTKHGITPASSFSANVWTHVLFTYDSSLGDSDRLKIYLDGINQSLSITGTIPTSLQDSSQHLDIGRFEGLSREWPGQIDEVQIWNRSLSSDEVQQLYMSNLYKYDSDKWALYVNQSKNATDGLDDGNYTYYAYTSDDAGNSNVTDTRTVYVDTTNPGIDYTTGTPADAATLGIDSVFVNVSVVESNPKNITFNLYNNDDTLNVSQVYTSGFPANYSHNFTSLLDAAYKYNVTVYDDVNNVNSTSTRTVGILTDVTTLDFCTQLNVANTVYTLVDNVTSTGTCFNVTASNVTLNCAGYEINYSTAGTLGYGVYSDQFNTSINDCSIVEGVTTTDSKYAIYFNGANNGSIDNVNTTNIGTWARGLYFIGSSSYNDVSNLDITGSGSDGNGMFVGSGSYNDFTNITVLTTGGGNDALSIDDGGSNNVFRYGNFTTTASSSFALQAYSGTFDATFIDSTFNAVNAFDVQQGSAITSASVTFLNVTFNKSSVSITDSDFTLFNQYYLDVTVNTSAGVPLENVNVTITNNSGGIVFTGLTDSVGEIPQQNLTEYTQNYTGEENKTFSTNYTVSTVITDYTSGSDEVNLTSNIDLSVLLSASLYNRSALGLETQKVTVNFDEDVNITIDIPNENLGGGSLSAVWAEITRSDSSNLNVSLNGSVSGGIWNGTYTNTGVLGFHNVTLKANLSTGAMLFETIETNFTVENTSIGITTLASVNTTDIVNVNGVINRYNGSEYVAIADNLFLIKLNDVLVSSDTYNDTNFSAGSAGNTNISTVVTLNLTNPGSAQNFSDTYDDNPTDSVNDPNVYAYNDIGYSAGKIFDLDQMSGTDGNLTYKFTTVTEFYNATVAVNTGSADVSGGNLSLFYSFDYSSWVFLNTSTSFNDYILGSIPVDGKTEFYVLMRGNYSSGENPVDTFSMNYTTYDYDLNGNFTSSVINLPNITYTVMTWEETTNGQTLKVQLRESDDGSTWDAWGTNFTSNLDNDISALTKAYVQYRVWFISTNSSLTPVLNQVNISYFNATTNSTGGYDYNITIPTDTLGSVLLNVSVAQNPTTGITGFNTTAVTVWARTTPVYVSATNYSYTLANYSVNVNFTRNDTAALINGSFNVTIRNSTGVIDSQTCVGVSNCIAWWSIPGDLSYGNYTVNFTVFNESGYYRNSSVSFDVFLEEKNTTGTLNAVNKTIGDFSAGTDYELDLNVTLNNTGNASMNDVVVYYFDPATSSAITSIVTISACSRVYPQTVCNATMRVTIDGGAASGSHRISWRANWTENQGDTAPYIQYQDMYVIISLNATMGISNSSVNKTIEHEDIGNFTFNVSATGSDSVTDITIGFVEGNITQGSSNISSSWLSFSTTSIAGIVAGNYQAIDVNVTVPAQTAPGNYSGTINVTSSNAGYEELQLIVTVPTNMSWNFAPTTNLTYNLSFGLSTAGQIANYTVTNIGNINITFDISYASSRTTDYTGFGTTLFQVNDTGSVPGSVMNPSNVTVGKGESLNFTLYQKGNGGAIDDVGVDITITNSTASPTSVLVQEAFWIFEQPPVITDVLFILDGVNGNKAEVNKDLTIKVRATDDVGLNESVDVIVNVTYPNSTVLTLNASDMCDTFGECDGPSGARSVANYSVNFTPVLSGVHSVAVTVFDAYGQSTTSGLYNFTAYATTILNLGQNFSSVTVTSIDKTTSYNFTVNYSINNTGQVYGYSPNLTFVKNDTYITLTPTYNTFSDIASDGTDYAIFTVNVAALTDPGVYNISSTLTWTNPNLGTDTDTETFSITVSTNRSYDISPTEINLTVLSSASNWTDLTITNTGNIDLSAVNVTCLSGTLCSSFTYAVNKSAFSVAKNSSTVLNISLTAPAGLAGGDYSGVVNISAVGISSTFNIYATVPSTYSWTASPLTANYTKAVSQSGTLETILLENTGNKELVIALSSTNSTIVGTNVSSVLLPISTNRSFIINYTSPAIEASYLVTITMFNSSASPTQLNITVNLTTTQANVTILSPTASSPLTDVLVSDTIEIHANATYQEAIITSNATWTVDIGGGTCTVLNSSYISASYYWSIYCTAPSITDGISHNLTVTMDHDTYGEISGVEADAIAYRDATAPAFQVTRNNITIGSTIDLEVNVTDSVGVDTVIAYVTYPNSTVVNLSLSLSSGLYINNSVTLNLAGEYSVNYTANDTIGNFNSTVDWFEVYDRYDWSFTMIKYDGNPVVGVNVSMYRPNDIFLFGNVTDDNGNIVLNVNKRNYDLHGEISGDEVIVRDVNFTNVSLNNISFNIDRLAVLAETVVSHKVLQGIASNSTGFDNNNVDLIFNYSGLLTYEDSSELEIVKCTDWNYSDRLCSGSWSVLPIERDIDAETITGNSTGFSAYFLAENKCNNGECNGNYGETTATCPADCASSGDTIIQQGGGGSSGGFSASDLADIKDLIRSFLDVGGVKIETTSIYKELFAGETTTVRIRLTNSLSELNTILLTVTGDIKDMLFFESTSITLEPNEKRDVLIRIVAPNLIESGNYDGDLVVTSGEEEGKIPVTIRILSPEGKLLDVKIQALKQTVAPGDVLRLQLDLLNLGKTKKVDVQFDLQLLDPETGELLTRTEEAFAVETSISTVKNMTIPDFVKPGRYMIKGTAYYSNVEKSMQATSITYVNVQYDFFSRKLFGVKFWVYGLGLLALLVISGLVFYVRWLNYRKKRFKVKIEFNKLPRASSHSAFAGKIAETDTRAFIDMNKLQMHTLIAGSTGSGKTVAAQGLIEAALLHKKGVIVFDPTAQWTGFLRKCEDKKMLGRYKFFNMKTKEAKGFNGSIKTIHDPYEVIDIKKYLDRPGEITVFNVSHLSPKQIDIVVASTIQQIFESEPEEAAELKTLIVYDEVHRLLPKFGGSGEGFVQIERGAREFRKWGIGLVLISQVLSDFVGEIKANIGTEIQMGTRYEGDLERVKMKYGEDVLKSVVKESIGTGMIVNAEYNSGRPYFIAFRPLLHSTKRLSNPELVKYEKYFDEIEDLDYQIEQFKALKVDVLDLELELKLAKSKVKEGQFSMSDMYLESLRPRFVDSWKKIGKEPMHIVKRVMKKEDIMKGVAEAKKGRESYIKKNPQEVLSLGDEIMTLKKLIEEKKRVGVNTSQFEITLTGFEDRLKPFKGKVPEDDAKGIIQEINFLKKDIEGSQSVNGTTETEATVKKVAPKTQVVKKVAATKEGATVKKKSTKTK